jgi:hypothetical protein
MSNKIPDKAKENLIKKWIAGADYTELARYLDQFYGVKVHRTTVMRYFKNEVLLTKEDFSDIELDSIDDRVKLDSRIAKYRAEALRYRRLYQLSIKKNLDGTSIIEAIQDAAISFKKVPLQNIPKPKGPIKGQSAQIVVAPLTDTHIGEDVDYQQMAGLNSYSFDIFNKRLFGWATTVLNLVQLRRASVPINELVIPMLGDMISGDIHDELIKTNQDNVMGQMIRGANLIAQALMYLAPHFKTITVPCVVGTGITCFING